MVLRQELKDERRRHRENSTTMSIPSTAHLDNPTRTIVVLFITCQTVAHPLRASNPATHHYLRHLRISLVTGPLGHLLAFPACRAVRLVTHQVESHQVLYLLQLIPNWREPERLLAVANRSDPAQSSRTRNMDELCQAALKAGHRAPVLKVPLILARTACPSFKACTFANVAPKSLRNSIRRMTSGKLKASRRSHTQKHVS